MPVFFNRHKTGFKTLKFQRVDFCTRLCRVFKPAAGLPAGAGNNPDLYLPRNLIVQKIGIGYILKLVVFRDKKIINTTLTRIESNFVKTNCIIGTRIRLTFVSFILTSYASIQTSVDSDTKVQKNFLILLVNHFIYVRCV